MSKYHISRSGKPAKCFAGLGECPLSPLEKHFDDIQSAQRFIEKNLTEEYDVFSSKKFFDSNIRFAPGQGVKDYDQLIGFIKDNSYDTETKKEQPDGKLEAHYDLANYYYIAGNVFNDYDNVDDDVKEIVDKYRNIIDNNLVSVDNKVYRGISTQEFSSIDELNDYAEKVASKMNDSEDDSIMSFSRNPYVGYSFSQGFRKVTTDTDYLRSRYTNKRNSGVLLELTDAKVYQLSYEYEDEDDDFALEKEVLSTKGKIEVYNIIPSDKNNYGIPIIQLTRK